MVGHEVYMREALALARTARERGEVPVGAVVVGLDGQVVGRGFNQPIGGVDPTGHAEVIALRDAAQSLQNYRLSDASLYVTVEPCLMCVGAIVHARIKQLVFGAVEPRSGAVGSALEALNHPSLNHRVDVVSGILEPDCREAIQGFFDTRRRKS